MAQRGNGDFFEFSAGQAIDFNQFAVPARNVRHVMRDLAVLNQNTLWWNGQLAPDSDADALPDHIEDLMGSNKYEKDSDRNGVEDGWEYRVSGRPCKSITCSPAGAEPYATCNGFEVVANAIPRVFLDQDKDGLNKCVERKLFASLDDDWDSNADWISDELALRSDIAFIPGRQEAALDPDWDNRSNYVEVKENTPLRYNDKSIFGLKPQKYKVETVSVDAFKTCYHVTVDPIMVHGEGNLIKVWVMENKAIVDDEKYRRVAEKPVYGSLVKFVDSDFR
jgi:hypothetical protein